MGGSSISHSDMTRHYETRSYSRATNAHQVFKSSGMPDEFNPAKIKLPREALDSALSPKSRAVIFAEDVSGSMHSYILELIRDIFPDLIKKTYESVSFNPHIMFMGIDDAENGDPAALQVTQFETDLRMLDQLEKIYLEGFGGGNMSESYLLAEYFAANFTKIDCFDKRGEKGFLFTFGDECPPERLYKDDLSRVFGGRDGLKGRFITAMDCVEQASKKYHCYHILLHGGNYNYNNGEWEELLGGHACDLSDYSCLADLVTTIFKIHEGKTKTEAIAEIENSHSRSVVERALKNHEETVEEVSKVSNEEEAEIEQF